MPRSAIWLVLAIGGFGPVAAFGFEPPAGFPAGEKRRAADWPEEPAALLEKLRLRDAGFDNRTIETEQRWAERVFPRGEIASNQFHARKLGGRPAPPPPDDQVPADFDQPHRVRQLLTVREPEVTLESLNDLEPRKHPGYGWSLNRGCRWSSAGGVERSWSPETNTLDIMAGPLDEGLLRWKAHMLKWGCGYGIGRWVESIDSVQAGDDLLTAKGRMRLMGYDDSRVELQLDRDLIMRRAVISVPAKAGSGSNEFVVETRGTVRPEGCLPVAESGRYRRIIKPDRKPEQVTDNYEIRFVAASPRLTDRQYDERTRISPGPKAFISDLRPRE